MEKLRGDIRDYEFTGQVLEATAGKTGNVRVVHEPDLLHWELEVDVDANEVRCSTECFKDVKDFMAARMAKEN